MCGPHFRPLANNAFIAGSHIIKRYFHPPRQSPIISEATLLYNLAGGHQQQEKAVHGLTPLILLLLLSLLFLAT
jgi:hypothetical protein